MAFIVIEMDTSDAVGELNALLRAAGNPKEGATILMNYLEKAISKNTDANLNVAVRSTSAGVSPSGGGSSVTYLMK